MKIPYYSSSHNQIKCYHIGKLHRTITPVRSFHTHTSKPFHVNTSRFYKNGKCAPPKSLLKSLQSLCVFDSARKISTNATIACKMHNMCLAVCSKCLMFVCNETENTLILPKLYIRSLCTLLPISLTYPLGNITFSSVQPLSC